jgi:hypothetical protein
VRDATDGAGAEVHYVELTAGHERDAPEAVHRAGACRGLRRGGSG